MYDRAVTALAVEEASKELGRPLVYHSQAQIDEAISYLDDLWDNDAKRFNRYPAPDEQAFIENERVLCALDFHYWLKYVQIINWRKQPQRFVPNVAQEIILNVWAEFERQGLAIWIQHLKARRLGVSTICELAVTHRFQFHPYSNCVIASADPDKTVEMAGIVRFCLDMQPWWLLPKATKILRSIPVEFGALHSTLTIQAGNQFNGVARGSSPNVSHLSELCEWQDAEALIDGALLPAILDTPDVFGVLESTAQGPGWWKKTWEQNTRNWNRGRARVRPVFLPYFVGTDLYPTEADLRKRPIPTDWIPSDRTIAHAERARQFVLADPLLFQYLAKYDKGWQMPKAQMWWREVGYENAREAKTLNIFLAEFCADPFEAFQNSNIPIIDPEILIGYQERTRNPVGVYTIVGPDIPQSLVIPSRHWDTEKPTITINTRDVVPRYDVKYQLIPLRFESYASFDEALKLLIWEYPREGYTYGIGVDTSEGIGQDNAVMEVLREATPMEPPAQVAEWAANTVTAFQLWPLVMAVGAMYSTFSQTAGKRVQCRLAIEAFMNGSATQNELQKRGWTNFHAWKYNDTRRPKADGEVARIGIYTNQWFRSAMMDMLLTCLSEEAIDLPSQYLVSELTTLERAADSKKAKAALDAHDDRVMGIGFPLFSLHMNKPPLKQYARRRVEYQPGLTPDEGIAYPVWTPPNQASSQPFQGPLSHQVYRDVNGLRLKRITNNSMPNWYR